MADSDQLSKRAEDAMARARTAPDLGERVRWLSEAVRLHLLALDRLAEESVTPEPRSFQPQPEPPRPPRRDH